MPSTAQGLSRWTGRVPVALLLPLSCVVLTACSPSPTATAGLARRVFSNSLKGSAELEPCVRSQRCA